MHMLYTNHSRSSSTIVTVAWPQLTPSGVEDELIVRVKFLSSSNTLSLYIGTTILALISPAGNITLYGPES